MSDAIQNAMINDIEQLKTHATDELQRELNEKIEKLKVGRKPFSPERQRKNRITASFNEEEYQTILAVADGGEVSAVLRELALDAARSVKVD